GAAKKPELVLIVLFDFFFLVPLPTNVVIESLNFKTVLRWDYIRMPEPPHFIVEIQPYELGKYKPVSICMNTTKHYCDLSKEIEDPIQSHWARVKAFIGLEESEYVETKEFVLRRDGKFKFLLFFQIEEHEAWPCKKHLCSIDIPFFSTVSTYCVSARGRSSIVSDRGFSDPIKLHSVTSSFKVTVIRNLNSRNVLETKPEAKYISVITSSSPKPMFSVSDEVNLIDQVDQVKEIGTPNPEDCSEETDTVSSQEISNKTEEMSIHESIAEMTPDDEESPRVKENYFHSSSSQTELNCIPSNPEPSNTEVQESLILKSCNKISGYDKPHVPMDLLIDVGEEESVIAYRHTDEVHES
uniref:Fibronectin type-III domain-containing protein n=1 Tax=Gopherus evgoodei TaxID=1825980 RepID=A0A8C4Y0W3_9SAUR